MVGIFPGIALPQLPGSRLHSALNIAQAGKRTVIATGRFLWQSRNLR